jgi:hypothetical protein
LELQFFRDFGGGFEQNQPFQEIKRVKNKQTVLKNEGKKLLFIGNRFRTTPHLPCQKTILNF